MDAADVVGRLCEATGDTYRLLGRCASGQSGGAFLIVGPDDQQAILKYTVGVPIEWHLRGERRVDGLRSAGVPIADQTIHQLDAMTVIVQRQLPGAPRPITRPMAEALVRFSELLAGKADEPPEAWRALMQSSLLEGLDGYCEHDSLRHASPRTAALLERITAIGHGADFDMLPAPDLVHYDLHPGNVLTEDGSHVSGIVDWDAVQTGDRLLDLVMLAFTASRESSDGVVQYLWDEAVAASTPPRLAVYAAHTALRLVDWVIRHEGMEAAAWAIDAGEHALERVERNKS